MKKGLIVLLALPVVVFLAGTAVCEAEATRDDAYRASRVDVPLKGKVLIITDNDHNDTELLYPYYRLVEEGYEVTIATLNGGDIAGYNTAPVRNTVPIAMVDAEDYKGLYLPGGRAPAILMKNDTVIEIVDHFVASGKPVGAICHGPQILAGAGALEGRKVTAWPDIEDEMVLSGAVFTGQPVVVDGNIATARMPGDLPPHVHAFLGLFEDPERE